MGKGQRNEFETTRKILGVCNSNSRFLFPKRRIMDINLNWTSSSNETCLLKEVKTRQISGSTHYLLYLLFEYSFVYWDSFFIIIYLHLPGTSRILEFISWKRIIIVKMVTFIIKMSLKTSKQEATILKKTKKQLADKKELKNNKPCGFED